MISGYSDYTYEDGTDWLVRETWHAAQSGQVFDLVRYRYTNGRPSYVEIANVSSDLQTYNGYTTYYLQYNWHGDVVAWVAPDGGGINATTLTTDPWGVYSADTLQYYLWNGAWGYLYFSQLKLYYVHGRWYNPETALWLSPDANGEYLYGSGQDAVNYAWAQNSSGRSSLPGVETELKALKYKWNIQFESRIYGIPWQVLAGVLESEIQLDTDFSDAVTDWILWSFPEIADWDDAPLIGSYLVNPGPGIGNIHILTAKATSKYMSEWYKNNPTMQLNMGMDYRNSVLISSCFLNYPLLNYGDQSCSIRVMAAHVRQLADYRFGSNGQPSLTSHANLSEWTITDAVAIWHGYRYGVPNISPPSQRYGFRSLEVFQDRSYGITELLDEVVQGIGAKQSARDSIKYFVAYWLMPD